MTHHKHSARDLFQMLDRKYQLGLMSTAVVPEASIGLGPGSVGFYRENALTVRRIDALILFREKRWAVEIKISRQDLRRELLNPAKSATWLVHVHSFYFFVPPHLLEYALENVPKPYGVMSLGTYGGIEIVRRASKNREPMDLPYDTVRRMGVAYGKVHRELHSQRTDRVPALPE